MSIKKAIKNMISLDHTMKQKRKEIRELKAKYEEYKKICMEFMKEKKIDAVDVGTHEIIYSENNVTATLSKTFILTACNKYFVENNITNDDELAKKIVDHIWTCKQVTGKKKCKIKLKQKKNKSPKQKISIIED